jgi:signal transduction histidine kinase
VIDRGCGIDPAQRDSIFNPFFTTKPQGVGLGLAIVSKIVDEHGGKITVESEPGKGSIFRVMLPMERRDHRERSLLACLLAGGSACPTIYEETHSGG